MTCETLTWNVHVTKYKTLNMVCIRNEASDIVIPCEVTDDDNLDYAINKVLAYCVQLHKKGIRFVAVDLQPDENQRFVSLLVGGDK